MVKLIKFSDYMEEVTSGFSMPEKKFCFDMVWGILKGGDILVSDVARAIGERILDSTEKRLAVSGNHLMTPKDLDELLNK